MSNTLRMSTVLIFVFLLVACGGNTSAPAARDANAPLPAGTIEQGAQLYKQNCASCHGSEGTGVEGLGKKLQQSSYISGLSDGELLDFLTRGRPANDPQNSTGVAMPPKGGNMALDDQQLMHIIAYLRSLQD